MTWKNRFFHTVQLRERIFPVYILSLALKEEHEIVFEVDWKKMLNGIRWAQKLRGI